MFESLIQQLTTTAKPAEELLKWCQQWCRMVDTGNDKENICQPYGLLLACASQSNPQALKKMIGVLWGETSSALTSNPQSCLKTAVGTLLATDAPIEAHLSLMEALKNQHKEYWNQYTVSKRQTMHDGVRVQILGLVMDHMAHAYMVPIDNKLSAENLARLFNCAGPVFVERFGRICHNYSPPANILEAFTHIDSVSSANLVLKMLKTQMLGARDLQNALIQKLSTQTSLNQIVDEARTYDPDHLKGLEIDRSYFTTMCWASQTSNPLDHMNVVTGHSRPHMVVQEVAHVWKCLASMYPTQNLSTENCDAFKKFLPYCNKQHDVSEGLYAQLQNLLLRSEVDVSTVSIAKVKGRKI